ncbi:hypothetical protein Lalb_Chr23g0273211 [Lupinus albus]|uniref:Uncharacterized protein n=1 Tax=Lupinus albus TaxID=3870 RepID=A0A6A4NLH7_LUPAL|nr:hypothetical protein Lalb_Chr23g0273211 [Lupinus albus]
MVVVVANIWGVSQYISTTRTQLRTHSTSFDFHQNKLSTLLLGTCGYHPFRTKLSIFTKRNRNHCFGCSANTNTHTSLNWDWNRWCRHFFEIEEADTLSSVLKFQLEDAVEKEDFHEAAKLNRAIAEATSKDSVAEIMSQLKSAIDDERYHDASRLCRYTGSGLVGWWVGYSKDPDDPFARIIHVSPGVGRFVGRSYSPRQLITKSTGTPIFEIYVVKDADNTYHMQVVYLRRAKGNSMGDPSSLPDKSAIKPEVESASTVDVPEHEEKVERNDKKNNNMEEATEEGIKSVINFLEQKIPGFKVKVMNINVSIKQLMEEDGNKASSNESPEGEVNNLDEPDGVTLGGDSDASELENDLDMKFFVGGVVQDNEDTPVSDDFTRLPAEIRDMERDSFAFHIPRRNLDFDMREHKVTNLKVATMASEGISQLMPPDVANEFLSSDVVSSKVSKSMREIVKLAIVKAQKRSRLSQDTYFRRIPSSTRDSDPFDGLYVGAFGPYGLEVVQLRRKFGHWNDADNENNPSDMEFFEYVEAVKLTGDLNVPAGQVTFRAKIGRGNRNTNRGMFPDELGVVASYNGQGRTADFGFRNPKWVDGELLQLNGKGMGPYMKGADLGFLYSVPEQSVLVLFNRLKLPA